MKKFLTLLLIPFLVSCASAPDDTSKFDAYLDQLMAEPYDPANGSKY